MVEEEGMTLMGAAAKSGVPYATRPNCETWLASQTGLGQMRVKHFTGESKKRQRHAAEQGPEICRAVIDLADKCPPYKIVLIILDSLLQGPESEFKPPQTFVAKGCPSQMQGVNSVIDISLDNFPEEIVVRPQPLKRIVGSAELVEGLPAMVKEDPRGQRFIFPVCSCNKPVALREYVAGDVLKKSERLRR